jgi:SagB-type dehydrogenase family enzyme
MISHQGVVNTILDVNQRFQVTEKDKVLALSSLSFDLSVYDIFGLLAVGGAIIIPDANKVKDASHWRDLVSQHQVTVWNSVPALMQMLLSESLTDSYLRLVLLSGDWIPLDLPKLIKKELGNLNIISLGGATEASIWSILYPIENVDSHWQRIPYGRPMANQKFYVLNEELQSCPIRVVGDLYIAGIGLATGYWQNEEKTKASFIIHPQTEERLYKTGDLGRYLEDGNIEFLGREDFQVKVNGYRIELGEIENTLKQHPAIKEAIVTVDSQQLIAYLLPEETLDKIDFKLEKTAIKKLDSSPSFQLPKPEINQALTQTYLQRQSYRQFLSESIPLTSFSQLLSCLLSLQIPNSPFPKYRYASAGSLYPVQVYFLIKPNQIEGLEAGFYYYHPIEHQLSLLHPHSDIAAYFSGNNKAIFESSAFALFLVGELEAITPMYGEQARDFCLLEAGYMSQLLMETAPKVEMGFCPIGALEFDSLREKLQLTSSQIFLHGLVGGKINPAWSNQWLPPQDSLSLTEKLRQFLSQKLPDYMIPSIYQLIKELPLNVNGKIDHQSLPKPNQLLSNHPTEFVEPTTEIEKKIAQIWQLQLSLDKVGIYDNFFDIGGNSFTATQILAKIRQSFPVDLSIRQFFENSTIADLAAFIGENSQPIEVEKIERIERVSLDALSQLSEDEVDSLLEKMLEEESI